MISVIIPVYNAEQYIKRCLNSVLNQTFNDYEIIMVNDGSTDGSLEIMNNYESQNNKLKSDNTEEFKGSSG